MVSRELETSLSDLEKYFSKSSRDKSHLKRCLVLIEKIKELMAKKNLSNDTLNLQNMLKTRAFLELAALVFLELNDTENFKIVYSQLHPMYFDFNRVLNRSQNMSRILSMWMLHLLSENKIGDLYMLLERIPDDLKRDDNIAFVINLERLMMEGDLGRLLDLNDDPNLSKLHSNNEYYKVIASTARNKIASLIELSYDKLSTDDMTKKLKLKNHNELLDFVSYYNQYKLQLDPNSAPWKLSDDFVFFQNENSVRHRIPSLELLSNSLEYLNDLEKIV